MLTTFDHYYKWLGIPPEEQPPNHYRLLGLRIFEHDADVIETAAEQRMMILRSRQTGPQADACQRLLNEIAAAQHCLLDADARRQYNDTLRGSSSERAIAITAPPPVPSGGEESPPARPPAFYAGDGRIESFAAPPPLPSPGAASVAVSEPPTAPPLAAPPIASPRKASPPPVPMRTDVAEVELLENDNDDETAVDAHVIDAAPPIDSWHVRTPDGSRWGPVSRGELDAWAANGRITAGCKLQRSGSDEWIDAARLLQLPPAPPSPPYHSAPNAPPVTGAAPAYAYGRFRCPRCGSEEPPWLVRQISAAGWVLFALLLVFFFPLCFIGLLITETKRVCRHCGLKTT